MSSSATTDEEKLLILIIVIFFFGIVVILVIVFIAGRAKVQRVSGDYFKVRAAFGAGHAVAFFQIIYVQIQIGVTLGTQSHSFLLDAVQK